jgi:hypothetical protein
MFDFLLHHLRHRKGGTTTAGGVRQT